MADLLLDRLPTRWAGREIDWDFRPMVWLSNMALRAEGQQPEALADEALRRFYRQPVPQSERCEAFAALLDFYTGGSEADGGSREPRHTELAFDYATDASLIVAAFQQAYGLDLTRARVHWWRFRALFAALPEDTALARVMSLRTTDLSGLQGETRQRFARLKAELALPDALQPQRPAVSVAAHEAAYLARLRHTAAKK